jgi:hypothetical protein
MTKLELDLCIPLTYLYIKFDNVYNCWGDYERELKMFNVKGG